MDRHVDGNGLVQLVTFHLGRERYGVEVVRVREIVRMQSITAVPRSPKHVLGVTNLRGSLVSVMDLRMRLGLERIPYGPKTRILIVEAGVQPVGLVVDSVADVMRLPREAMGETSGLLSGSEARCVRSVAEIGDGSLLLELDLDDLLGGEQDEGQVSCVAETSDTASSIGQSGGAGRRAA
ncbi:purine-binding chemotaxis protein CheW [Desulfobaculum xiamenense]|uniref:Purine-binding chemotaxis protein CheW n=1 Tax=Desulfobaculum xiamenense TaxID=995050 RepID=A0A846QT01_9BACT|nr:chemotaxis protein CheW [Desulfobaculum xiamenense]NJB68304.1 purine-binding chemotaxis protein CheW [Desulfobaculum xiamenense]